ncbi:MAG: serine hydrolase [Nocardioidaceae bacterium]
MPRVTSAALTTYIDSLPDVGTYSLWFGPLDGPPVSMHQADSPHYAASTMKLALALAAFRRQDAGELDLDTTVPVHNDFASAYEGRFAVDRDEDSDPEPWQRMGTDVSLRWLAYRSIVRSSNLATNLLLDAVGREAVATTLSHVGTTGSVVARGIEDAAARESGLQNIVTAADLARTLQSVATGRAASADSCRELLDVLAAQQINDAIPAGLPAGVKVAHKSGWVEGISHDAGIVYPADDPPYILVVCTSSALTEQAGRDLIAAGAKASWQDRAVMV